MIPVRFKSILWACSGRGRGEVFRDVCVCRGYTSEVNAFVGYRQDERYACLLVSLAQQEYEKRKICFKSLKSHKEANAYLISEVLF